MSRQRLTQINRKRDGQIEIRIYRQTDRQTDRQVDGWMDGQAERCADEAGQMSRQTKGHLDQRINASPGIPV